MTAGDGNGLDYVYCGQIDRSAWFPEPSVGGHLHAEAPGRPAADRLEYLKAPHAMTDFVSQARAWAIEKHGTQTYGKGENARPYAYHLGAVAEIAAPYGETAQVVARRSIVLVFASRFGLRLMLLSEALDRPP